MNDNRVSGQDIPQRKPETSIGGAASNNSSKEILVPLKTTLELRGGVLGDVYVTAVHVKAANLVLNLLRNKASGDGVDLQHLRRFAKFADLPPNLKASFSVPDQDSDPMLEEDAENESGVVAPKALTLCLLIGPVESVSLSVIKSCLHEAIPESLEEDIAIWTTPVPLLAPTSQAQADAWSREYWPTVYKKSNPFGPHPSIVSRAAAEIRPDVLKWINMARQVATKGSAEGIGEAIGAVIVRRDSGTNHAIALACDARWASDRKDEGRNGPGDVMGHAVLRAIGMVARKLQTLGEDQTEENDTVVTVTETELDRLEADIFNDKPLVPEEQTVYDEGKVSSVGYLCHNLEIYLTHEPCVMCSMAILHSRFGRVVFEHRMPMTGGLCGERESTIKGVAAGGLGHGLFWRKELNWSLLAWELDDSVRNFEHLVDSRIQA